LGKVDVTWPEPLQCCKKTVCGMLLAALMVVPDAAGGWDEASMNSMPLMPPEVPSTGSVMSCTSGSIE